MNGAVREHLEKVLSSPGFTASPRLARFLRFIVEHRLDGKLDAIQEYVIGVEVFDRKESFDPRVDSIVRVEAHRLRTRLKQYYDTEGREDPIRIELPRRGYVPEFRPYAAPRPAQTRMRRIAAAAATLVLLAAAAWWIFSVRRQPRSDGIASVGVLPFENHSGDPGEDYFCDGITDALITGLARDHSLRVISRTSMMGYKSTTKPAPRIARELHLDYLVEGGVLRSGGRLRVAVQLIEARSDKHIWARTYERPASDVLELQRELVLAIAPEISGNLGREKDAGRGTPAVTNPKAYDAYLKGKFAWHRWTEEGARASIEYFQQAIASDSGFAAAHAWLASGYRQLFVMGDLLDTEAPLKARAAALRAVQLDPDLAEAHFSLGGCDAYEWNWPEAAKRFQQAIRLEPENPRYHHGYAILYLAPMGRLDEAEAEIRQALKVDPASLEHKVILGKLLYFQGRYDAALAELHEVLRLDPNYPDGLRNLGAVYAQTGAYREAQTAHEKARTLAPTTWGQGLLAYAHAVAGQRQEARRLLDSLLDRRRTSRASSVAIASGYAGLGERSQAFHWFDRAYEDRDFRLVYLNVDPMYASLRSDPSFAALARKLGIPSR